MSLAKESDRIKTWIEESANFYIRDQFEYLGFPCLMTKKDLTYHFEEVMRQAASIALDERRKTDQTEAEEEI